MSSATDRLRKVAKAAASAAINLTRPNYFNTSEKGELYELRKDLNSSSEILKKEAVKQIIASMTIGKDVSSLFAEVLKCMQTDDLELKKLVYLYLMNYAKSQPDLVILAVNTFCKDPSPLIRALALRTMSCIRVEKIIDYLCEPLHRTLHDESPYVRKTAVICVAKLFDISPDLVDENGFLDTLRSMLSDSNSMVLSNVVAALADIHAQAPELGALEIDERIASKLVGSLGNCTEWGQVAILDALADYVPPGVEQLEFCIDSIIPRLQHANPSIVMSAIKVISIYATMLPRGHDHIELVQRKLAPPLVTLLSAPPEIQYVALRNIRLLLQKQPEIMNQGVRVFFCKYNDPLYVKIEKLQLILLLADEHNVEMIYPEIVDYAKEVDIEFVRRAIRCIADLACKLPSSAHQAIDLLVELSKSDARHVVQEALVATRQILSQNPEPSFIRALPELCRDVSFYDECESRSALLWLIGEHIDLVPEGHEILGDILDNFKMETSAVQSELFTCILKLYLQSPDSMKPVISSLIQKGKSSIESAEFRDRAIFYERLVELDPRMLRSLSLSTPFEDQNSYQLDPRLVDQLIRHIGTLAAVYHKLPEKFVSPRCEEPVAEDASYLESPGEALAPSGETIIHPQFHDLLDMDSDSSKPGQTPSPRLGSSQSPSNLLDLLS